MKTLAVISHTEHYLLADGRVAGWGATIRELDHLTEIFDKVYHVAPLYKGDAPQSVLPYKSEKVEFIPISPSGGEKIFEKFSVLTTAPGNLRTVLKVIKKADYIQLRLPTGIGLYLLPILSFLSKKFWVKYAGNWIQESPPRTYAFQRWWLNRNFQNSPVTINGSWIGQRSHLFSFENPCLDADELSMAREIANQKSFESPLNILFVGRLEDAKGVHVILEALEKLEDKAAISKVVLVGNGPERKRYEEIASRIAVNIEFRGFQDREALKAFYTEAHILLLPSASEGFPKVVAEAAAYGALPIASNVSSIGQYVKDGDTGYLLEEITGDCLTGKLNNAIEDRANAKQLAMNANKMAYKFTFEYYNKRIKEEILPQLK